MGRRKQNFVNPELLETFKTDLDIYGLDVALHNYAFNIASDILRQVGVTGIHLTYSKHKTHRKPA